MLIFSGFYVDMSGGLNVGDLVNLLAVKFHYFKGGTEGGDNGGQVYIYDILVILISLIYHHLIEGIGVKPSLLAYSF